MQTPSRSDLLLLLTNLPDSNFNQAAEAIRAYQMAHNPLFAQYAALLGVERAKIPLFLPIAFFKSHRLQTGTWAAAQVFSSSGTSGQTTAQHLVRDPLFYLDNSLRGFTHFYENPEDWAILALLPAYLERSGSSLVAMADYFIQKSRHAESGFFLHDFDALKSALIRCQSKGCKTLLLGVSFALLDFSEQHPMDLNGITIMETGGMKGRRKEITRTELHEILQTAFQVPAIHSEYGMTELFSQAYAQGGTRFRPAPTMRVMVSELQDPFCFLPPGRPGVLNIIDLANLDTCSFIQTEDLGRVYEDGSFEVLGRADYAELRGCNLMVEGWRR